MQQYSKFAQGKANITDKELSKAKEYLKGHMVLELEDSRFVAALYAQAELLEQEIETPEELLKKIDAITIKQVEKVASKYFVESGLNLAIIGNFKNPQRFNKLLKF
jgi:predicted Zn-dependent peptidase